jgi:hypothetical protein
MAWAIIGQWFAWYGSDEAPHARFMVGKHETTYERCLHGQYISVCFGNSRCFKGFTNDTSVSLLCCMQWFPVACRKGIFPILPACLCDCMRRPHMLHVSIYFVTKCSTHFLLRFAKCGFVTYALFATLISEMLHEFIDHGEMVQMMLHMDKKITIWIN